MDELLTGIVVFFVSYLAIDFIVVNKSRIVLRALYKQDEHIEKIEKELAVLRDEISVLTKMPAIDEKVENVSQIVSNMYSTLSRVERNTRGP